MSVATKGLIEFVNPYKLPKFVKQVHLQMREIEGRQPFGQGLYHCNNYENLIKRLTPTRQQYRQSKEIETRKQLATQEFQAWTDYIKERTLELPQQHQVTGKQLNELRRSYEVFIAKGEKGLRPSELLNVFNDYTRVNQFMIPVDNWCVLQMVHYNMGYPMNMNRLLTFEEIATLVQTKVLATYERSLGQDLLFREICSYGYWNLFDQSKGYMNIKDFSNFVKIFKYNVEPTLGGILKEFGFAANLFQGEFAKEIDPKEDIVRFDFFRYLFLERNL